MAPIKEDILKKIEKDEITPKPRWWFVIGHVLLWVFFVLTVIIWALAFGMMLFEVFSSDRELLAFIRSSGVDVRNLSILPYVWISSAIITVVISFFFFRSTSHGYQHETWKMFTALFAISILLGGVLYMSRASEFADKKFQNIPHYQELREDMRDRILSPDRWVLPGVFVQRDEDVAFRWRWGEEWVIIFDCMTPVCEKFMVEPIVERPVLLIGERGESEQEFSVRDVRNPQQENIRKILEQRKGPPNNKMRTWDGPPMREISPESR